MFRIGEKDGNVLFMSPSDIFKAFNNFTSKNSFSGQQWKRIKKLAKKLTLLGITE